MECFLELLASSSENAECTFVGSNPTATNTMMLKIVSRQPLIKFKEGKITWQYLE